MQVIPILVCAILVSGAMTLARVPALAQDSAATVDKLTGKNVLTREMLLADAPANKDRGHSDALRFSPSPETTRKLNEEMADSWARETGLDRRKVLQLFESGKLQGAFASRMAKAGFSTNRLDDVMAGYLIVMYEIANNVDTGSNAAAYPVIRDRVRSGLAQNLEVLALTNAEKQALSEALAILSMIAYGSRNDLNDAGDVEGLRALQRGARDNVLELGLDITTVKIAPEGFVPR